jgi:predicted small lipoprotein YifL
MVYRIDRMSHVSVAPPPARAALHARTTLWLVLVLGVTAGCGQKGPLTLPSADKAASTPAAR